ncbi:MAG: DUF2974 domain-containing protein [Roseburia sp.]|nr:DUF2974 domain-containing protein [Anaeroplasma bactoclasticum]MCM1195721.1 DUF2974 domain-containing protein [Roseburia sp.]MCM1556071.1 DUF2974 domain-containing protein [Anaeroplasma bactoclasticum]
MNNILYYVKKFGNRSFEEFPFNEVDGLILSQISYMNLDSLLPTIDDTMEDVSLLEGLDEDHLKIACRNTLDRKNNYKLIHLLKKASRFEGLYVNYFSNQFSVEEVEQFCAMTFLFKNFMFVAYRGTDITLLGWKENLTMSYLDVIPSQREAVRYLEKVSGKRELPIYLGGHSKGGNLAVYAAYSVGNEIQDRITFIYDYDGPGFQTDIPHTEQMKNLMNRIEKYTCREAMVGILLNHSEDLIFVKTKGLSIFQHDPYNWIVTKEGKFKLVDKANIFSKTFEKTTHDFIETSSIEVRKRFLEILFQVSMEHSYSTVLDWVRHPIRSISGIIKRYKNLTSKQRTFFRKMLKKYRIMWKQNFKLFLHQK